MTRRNRLLSATAAGIASVLIGVCLATPGLLGLVVGAAATSLLCFAVLRSPRLALLGLVTWLATLGLVRRLVAQADLPLPGGDPLVLVGAITLVALAAVAIGAGALRGRSHITSAVLSLMVLLSVSALNPLQGGMSVGLGGVLLTVVPMLAFFVGRALLDERLLRTLALLIAGLAVPAALYGLCQAFVGFPSWDEAYADRYGYVALNVVGVDRAFSSFTAASEYATFLGIGIVIWVAFGLRGRRVPLAVAGLSVLSMALWFEASRGIVVITLLAVAMVLAAQRGVRASRAVIGALTIVAVIPFAVGLLGSAQYGNNAASALAQHQIDGLSDPFAEESSLHSHIELVAYGLREAFRNPAGRGVGAVTTAAGKFGGESKGTEADLGNAGIAAGILGLLSYVAVALLAIPRIYRIAASRRDPLSSVVLGIILVTVLQWLNGGQYAVAYLPWLVMGWADRLPRDQMAETREPRTSASQVISR